MTLIELLVVIAILAILSTVGFGQYKTSQLKARDAQRKADLGNLSRALEMYYSDFRHYPLADEGSAKMIIDGDIIDWGTSFETETTIYMKVLPADPVSNFSYCYQAPDGGASYKIFAKLENRNDPDRDDRKDPPVDYFCLGDTDYNYGMASANVVL